MLGFCGARCRTIYVKQCRGKSETECPSQNQLIPNSRKRMYDATHVAGEQRSPVRWCDQTVYRRHVHLKPARLAGSTLNGWRVNTCTN
jgi:hypothetical protein